MKRILIVTLLFSSSAMLGAEDFVEDTAPAEAAPAPCLGVNILPITPDLKENCDAWRLSGFEEGIVVFMVLDISPATAAGFRPSDVIFDFNGERVMTAAKVVAAILAASVGDAFKARFIATVKGSLWPATWVRSKTALARS